MYMWFIHSGKSRKDAEGPALRSVQTYLTDFRRNQKSQVCDFVGFQRNVFHDVNSLFIDKRSHLVVTTS